MQSAHPNYQKGALFGLAAVSIWAGWHAMTRLAVTTGQDAWDIPALRFGMGGLLLLPIIARRGLALDRLGWLGFSRISAGTVGAARHTAPDGVANSIRVGHHPDLCVCVSGKRGTVPSCCCLGETVRDPATLTANIVALHMRVP
jgi:hypothetical protein